MQQKSPEPYLDIYGKAIYAKLIEVAAGFGVEIDPISGSIMSMQLAIIQRASDEINRDGITQQGQSFSRQTPAVKTFNDASSKFLSYAQEFGLTASARKRLFHEVEKLKLSDALDRLITDDSYREFESQPHDHAQKKNARTLRTLRDGTDD